MNKQTTSADVSVIDPEQAYPAVEKMLYDLAWRTVKKHPFISFEEAKSQACWGFMQTCRLYREGKGASFATYCYFVTSMHLKNLVMARTENAVRFPTEELEEELCGAAPEASAHTLLDTVQTLPQDARDVVAMLLETPAELVGVAMTPKQLLKKVKALLVERHGKTAQQVEDACRVLRNHFQQEWAS